MQHKNVSQSYSISSFYKDENYLYSTKKTLTEPIFHNIPSFEHYSKNNVFHSFKRIKKEFTSNEEVLNNIFSSGLCGCGGSHILLEKKWQAAIKNNPEYLIVNGQEGEPFTFKDYLIMKSYPYILLEGIAIACKILKIKNVFLIVNSSYTDSYKIIKDILSENLALLQDININLIYGPNPDRYITGEETALLNYIEGQRGEARLKPPFPHEKGLWGKPSIINNVETLSWLPIILDTPDLFSDRHPKLVSLFGDASQPGIYEIKIGENLKNIIQLAKSIDLAFVEIGGVSGGLIPINFLDVSYDNNVLKKLGVQIGTGAIRLFNSTRDPLTEMSSSIHYFKNESCGRCTPCRIGTQNLSKFVDKLTEKELTHVDINWLHNIAKTMQTTSICGLGRSAPTPILNYLKYYGDQ